MQNVVSYLPANSGTYSRNHLIMMWKQKHFDVKNILFMIFFILQYLLPNLKKIASFKKIC